jgi:geranylgeranyl diphosphate synthase, type II
VFVNDFVETAGRPAAARERGDTDLLERYLLECRSLALDEIRDFIPKDRPHSGLLYDLMLDYPLREAKGLRPALAIATCRALGGRLAGILRTAAVLELYHNAFLIHDDVEDDSELRRNAETLHRRHGVPIAVNVGDGMLALALAPLLDNMRIVGMGKALRILQAVGEMARASAEGQAIELEWIRDGRWGLDDRSYLRMIHKKSAWYTFVTPVTLGALVAGADAVRTRSLQRFAMQLGLAFQIQDDILNLVGEEADYGKEIGGDLWEGKHTMILLHALRCSDTRDRERAEAILRKRRPSSLSSAMSDRLDALVERGDLTPEGRRALVESLVASAEARTEADVRFLKNLIDRHGSIGYARAQAQRRARHARRILNRCGTAAGFGPSVHRAFLERLVDFVVERTR